MTGLEARPVGEAGGGRITWRAASPPAPCTSAAAAASAPGIGGTEKGENRADPVVLGVARGQAQLGEDTGHVSFDGTRAEEQLFRYPEVGTTLGHVPEHRALAFIESVDLAWPPVPLQQAAHDGRVDYRLTRGDPGQVVHEATRVGDVVFQQVTDAGPHRLEQLARVSGLRIRGQDENADLR